MQGHARTRLQMQPHVRRGLDTIEIEDLVAVEDRQVAGLADFRNESFEDRAPLVAMRRMLLDSERHCREARPDDVALSGDLTLDEAALCEETQDSIDGGLGKA